VVLPPVQLNQFRIYHNAEKRPVGFASWAKFSPEVEDRFLNGNPVLSLDDWRSGDTIYFMEFIAPFGHITQMVKDLRKLFRGQKTHAVRFDGDRLENRHVSTFYGYKR
jgi:cytolysin-activating lysine-acyltransferase